MSENIHQLHLPATRLSELELCFTSDGRCFPDYGHIQEKFSLCKPPSSPQDIFQLYGLLRNAFVLMAMLDYPYSTHFIGNMPANPVKVQTVQIIGGGAFRRFHLPCSSGGLSDHAGRFRAAGEAERRCR